MLTAIERAFEIARSGRFRTVDEVERKLKEERYHDAATHLRSSSLRKQLAAIIAASLSDR